MRAIPKSGEVYKHFKGNYYRVVTIAHHSETDEQLVIYQALYGEQKICARPLEMFLSPVDHEKYPEVTQKDRFELVEMPQVSAPADRAVKFLTETAQSAKETIRTVAAEVKAQAAEVKAQAAEVKAQAAEPFVMHTPQEQISPIVMEYLEAETYDQKIKVIDAHHQDLDEHMLITMAVAIDCDLKGESLYDQIDELRYCLMTRKRFEVDRASRRI